MARVPQHRAGSDHQNASQIAIALFRGRSELLLAPSRIFPRHESHSGREVTDRIEKSSDPERLRRSQHRGNEASHAPITPIPGRLSSRAFLDRSNQRLLKLRPSTTRLVCASTGKRASCSLAMMFSNSLVPWHPCAATMPSSAKCARRALITWVRWRMSIEAYSRVGGVAGALAHAAERICARRPSIRFCGSCVGSVALLAISVRKNAGTSFAMPAMLEHDRNPL